MGPLNTTQRLDVAPFDILPDGLPNQPSCCIITGPLIECWQAHQAQEQLQRLCVLANLAIRDGILQKAPPEDSVQDGTTV